MAGGIEKVIEVLEYIQILFLVNSFGQRNFNQNVLNKKKFELLIEIEFS